jgi:large subunit ribosomal protein L18
MKDKNKLKQAGLEKRHDRVRRKMRGDGERPRLVVFRSLNHMVAEIVDDVGQKTLMQVSSTSKQLSGVTGEGSLKMRRSAAVGTEIAKRAVDAGIKRVMFDRGGRLYHGRIKALAEAARKGGLQF